MPSSRTRGNNIRRKVTHGSVCSSFLRHVSALPTQRAGGAGVGRRLDRIAWAKKYLGHYLKREFSQFHRELADLLGDFHARRGSRLAIEAPRGSAKTTWLTLIEPLYCVCEGIEPYILLVAQTAEQSELYLEAIKDELEGNPAFATDYPHAAGRGKVWSERRIYTRNGCRVEAVGVGTKIRGKRSKEHRPSYIVCDDLEDDKHVLSPAYRAHHWRWFTRALINAGDPDTNYCVVGNAVHRDAIVRKLRNMPTWRHKQYKSIVSWPANMARWAEWEELYLDVDTGGGKERAKAYYYEHRDDMHSGAQVLWPEHEDLLTLMKLRAEIGRPGFEAEKQSNPIADGQCEFPDEYFSGDVWFTEWPENLTVRVMALDPSKGKDARRGDYSAIIMLGRSPDGILYVQANLERRPIAKIIEDCIALARRFKPDSFGVEANQFQQLLAKDLVDMSAAYGIMLPVEEIINTLPKPMRIRRHIPRQLAHKRMKFKAGCPHTRLLVDQLRDYRGRDTTGHDDGPDALDMAIVTAMRVFNQAYSEQRDPLEELIP